MLGGARKTKGVSFVSIKQQRKYQEFTPKMNQDHRRGKINIHWVWQSQSFKAWKSGGMREYFWIFYILGIFLCSLLGYIL